RVHGRMGAKANAVDSELDALKHPHLARERHRLFKRSRKVVSHLLAAATQSAAGNVRTAGQKTESPTGFRCGTKFGRLVDANKASVNEYSEDVTRVKTVPTERRESGFKGTRIEALNEGPHLASEVLLRQQQIRAAGNDIELVADIRPKSRGR